MKLKKNVFVNAINMHSGGGRTLMNGLLKGLIERKEKVFLYVDKRFNVNYNLPKSINLIKINKFSRYKIDSLINKKVKSNDIIIYFGNLPPLINFKTQNVKLLLSSRFYVDSINMKGFKLIDILKIYFEKIYFQLFIKNVSEIIVQTSSMSNKLRQFGFKKKISVLPYDDIDRNSGFNEKIIKKPSTFIYVASLLPYKNHKRLLNAWYLLKKSNINPKLYLTIDEKNNTEKWIRNFINNHNLNVELLENLNRDELIKKYIETEVLIYPSLFEAYGLPLIEAKKYNMKIISSDLDYCWDFLTPDDFFNPYDHNSIYRSIKRYLNIEPNLDKVVSPKEFLNKVID